MEKGMKNDKGKLRFDLVPAIILKALAQVFTFGAKKYKDNSWQQLENFEDRYMAAAHRHISAHQLGELRDEESGLYHLDHALWNLGALRWKLEQEVVPMEFSFGGEIIFEDVSGMKRIFGEGHPEIVFTMEGIPKEQGMTVHDDVDTET